MSSVVLQCSAYEVPASEGAVAGLCVAVVIVLLAFGAKKLADMRRARHAGADASSAGRSGVCNS